MRKNSSRRSKKIQKRKSWNKGSTIKWLDGFNGLLEKTHKSIHGMDRLQKSI